MAISCLGSSIDAVVIDHLNLPLIVAILQQLSASREIDGKETSVLGIVWRWVENDKETGQHQYGQRSKEHVSPCLNDDQRADETPRFDRERDLGRLRENEESQTGPADTISMTS